MVEGYFDFAMAIQGGVTAVVASSGTALTQPQAQLLRRFAARVVLSFDPDAAGQGAAVRSCDLLVREGFEVNVALLPRGRDPDLVVREEGGEAYQAIVDRAQPYLDFLVDRAVKQHDTATPSGRLAFLQRDAGRRRGQSRKRRRATSSPIGCRCGPASARTSSATRSARRPWPARPASAAAASGVAGAAHRGRARPADAPDVRAGRGRRRGDASWSRPTWSGWRRGHCSSRPRPWRGTNGPRAGPDRSPPGSCRSWARPTWPS